MEYIKEKEKIQQVIKLTLENKILKKIVFSMPSESSAAPKCEGVLFEKGNDCFLGLTFFSADNKAIRNNYPLSQALELLCDMALSSYKRTNIITPIGDCSVMISKKGKMTVIDKIKFSSLETTSISLPVESHNKKKNYIITPENSLSFLSSLGICSEDGRIHDKKMSKFRQINKFLEIVEGIYKELPQSDDELIVCDLCCGKSYLSFAVYYYLTEIKKRSVNLFGADLKRDVIIWCDGVAKELHYEGMRFEVGDISKIVPEEKPHMVISLHACDIATDIVLNTAMRLNAEIILSTPCCHRYLNGKVAAPQLKFVTDYPHIQNKLCEAITDALRLARLKAGGYIVSALELTDPENTPKNTLIRAIKNKNQGEKERQKAKEEYEAMLSFVLGDKAESYLSEIE
jgi:hypothetical protein